MKLIKNIKWLRFLPYGQPDTLAGHSNGICMDYLGNQDTFCDTLREGKSIIHKKNLENYIMIIKATNKIGQLFSNS